MDVLPLGIQDEIVEHGTRKDNPNPMGNVKPQMGTLYIEHSAFQDNTPYIAAKVVQANQHNIKSGKYVRKALPPSR